MAHSIEKYKGRTENFNDLDLLVILGFALQIIRQSTQFHGLQSLAKAWQEVPQMYGPGVIHLKIEELIETPTQIKELTILLETVFNEVSKYHPKIPADVLKKIVEVPGVTVVGDYDVSLLNAAVRKLQSLIVEQ